MPDPARHHHTHHGDGRHDAAGFHPTSAKNPSSPPLAAIAFHAIGRVLHFGWNVILERSKAQPSVRILLLVWQPSHRIYPFGYSYGLYVSLLTPVVLDAGA